MRQIREPTSHERFIDGLLSESATPVGGQGSRNVRGRSMDLVLVAQDRGDGGVSWVLVGFSQDSKSTRVKVFQEA